MKNKTKKIIVIVLAAAILLGAGGGAWYYFANKNAEPVYVFPFEYVGMTEYWGDSQESYGPVTTDRIQTVYVSNTQTVTEMLVSEGDTVKKGDLLMVFDTTLSDLALERKRLDVEKLKLQLEDAKAQLKKINSMKPMVIPNTNNNNNDNADKNQGTALSGSYQISTNRDYDGSKKELALICWLGQNTSVGDELLEAIRVKAEEFQRANANDPAKNPPAEGEDATEPAAPVQVSVDRFYVIFKVTKGDMSLGQRQSWSGLNVKKSNGSFTFKFFDASGISDHMLADMGQEEEEQPQIDFGSGFTASQIAQMRSDQEKTIRELEFKIKMAEADYKIMLTEVGDGKIYAQIDGQVVSLLSEEEAKQNGEPIMKVSGGGGFYIHCTVSELEKDNITVGQEVSIQDWNTGMTHTGTIQSIGDFPDSNGYWNGMGNPNASYYPFVVFVGEEANLQEGRYVNVTYSTGTNEHGVYLQNPFLRTEQGKSYVYVMGEDGRLEQRFVQTGKALWGSYMEILSGLTAEDLVAFPYGKNIKPGAMAQEGDMSDLYN